MSCLPPIVSVRTAGSGALRRLAAAVAAFAFAAGSADAQTTRTLTYAVGTPGTPSFAEFSWTVTNVVSQGTFVDGTPWIRVAAGAQLIDVSPKSELKTTTSGVNVFINGSAKNPRMQNYTDPDTLQSYRLGKALFDGRQIFMTRPVTQLMVDSEFDFAANVGAVNASTGQIVPVPLAAGDVVVTAKSQWIADGRADWTTGGQLPNTDPTSARRTAIDRFGVLTVVATAPSGVCFRPPLQWRVGHESTRPAPIPVSQAIANDSLLHHGDAGPYSGLAAHLTSPNFQDGINVNYQSSHAQHAVSAVPTLQNQALTYGSNMAQIVLRPMLLAATDTSLPAGTSTDWATATRLGARNRLIQYGIDSYGAAMSLGRTWGMGGHRAACMKPWILLNGYWLNRAEYRNFYQTMRTQYAGTAVAGLDDVGLGRLLFHDDNTPRQVVSGRNLGSGYHQVWGPAQAYRVTGSGTASSARLMSRTTVEGSFGVIDISGAVPQKSHAKHPDKYFGCFLRIESGPGSGSTVYNVLEVGNVGGVIGSFVKVDRPWQHGMPGPTSVVRMFPFRNGDYVPGLTSDVGRWYFSSSGQSPFQNSVYMDCLSPVCFSYARISYKSYQFPYAALKRLADATGDKAYVRGATWNWLAEVIGGTGRSLVTGEFADLVPESERILNQDWLADAGGLGSKRFAALKTWLGYDGTPEGFGYVDRSRLPGTAFVSDRETFDTFPCPVAASVGFGRHAIATMPGETLELAPIGAIASLARIAFGSVLGGPVEVRASAVEGDFDIRLAVLVGCEATGLVVANDDDPSGLRPTDSRVAFVAAPGVTYLITIGGADEEQYGELFLDITRPEEVLPSAVGNEADEGVDGSWEWLEDPDEAGAGLDLPVAVGMIGLGRHPFRLGADPVAEPLSVACDGGRDGFGLLYGATVFRFVPARDGLFLASLCGETRLDTRLAVLAGPDASAPVACADDSPGCGRASEVTFEARAGEEYLILVGTASPRAAGRATLVLERIPDRGEVAVD